MSKVIKKAYAEEMKQGYNLRTREAPFQAHLSMIRENPDSSSR